MKKLTLLFLTVISFSFACSGDCLSCHPKLQANIMSDERHKPMLTCVACHKEEGGVSECGKDCFSCHKIEKIDKTVKEHRVITECRECHMAIPKTTEPLLQRSSDTTIRDMLFTPR